MRIRLRGSWVACLLTCALCVQLCYTADANPRIRPVERQYDNIPVHISQDKDGQAREFFSFVTRPDIVAPRWKITTYEEGEHALALGYWFVALYEDMNQHANERRPWVGPHIYDQQGELVWSGAPLFTGWDVADFHVSTVNGEDMLTGLWKSEESNFVLDNTYDFHKKLKISHGHTQQNMHDWHTVWDGTRAIAIVNQKREASREESDSVGFHGGLCKVAWNGFEEYDTTTWNRTFSWDPEGHILLTDVFVEVTNGMCRNHWDYIHLNSVDKFADGDFLLSGRHSDTLYKISAKDGSIVWKFNGRNFDSDVEFSDHFSGQHHARIHMENDTHTIITLMDNAIRPGWPHVTNNHSRGMTILLHTDVEPLRAEVLQTYIHPQQEYAVGRGSMQILENDNVFAGWWWKSLQSEYSPEGKLLLEAETIPELKNYRSYKFPWTGRPKHPPDVVAVAGSHDIDGPSTSVYVSWNGATEVHQWNVYESIGGSKNFITSAPRQGFETAFAFPKSISHVVVEALDEEGNLLGASNVVESVSMEDFESTPPPETHPSKPFAHQMSELLSVFDNPLIAYIAGLVTCAIAISVPCMCWRLMKRKGKVSWWRQTGNRPVHRYERVVNTEENDNNIADEDIYMDDLEVKSGKRKPG